MVVCALVSNSSFEKLYKKASLDVAIPKEYVENTLFAFASNFFSGASGRRASKSPSRWLIQSCFSLGVMSVQSKPR